MAWCLALTCFFLVGIVTFIQRDVYVEVFGSQGTYGFCAGLLAYYALVFVFPAYKIKALIERREAVKANASQYNA